MSWQDLLQDHSTITLPWTGEKEARSWDRAWRFSGDRPAPAREYGWYSFLTKGRFVTGVGQAAPNPAVLRDIQRGYLVGDRFVATHAFVDPDPKNIAGRAEPVYLIEPGLDRFVHVSVGRAYDKGPLIYRDLEMPLGPEPEVLKAFLDAGTSVSHVAGVTPALDAAFRMECWQREEVLRRRRQLERLRREEEERQAREAKRQDIARRLGDGAGRREMAAIDFGEAARAALAIGGATLLDHLRGRRGEHVVRFRLQNRRFECVCDDQLRIADAGICLHDHLEDIRGDTWFTLESLPGVIAQAIREGKLVVLRHV